ncbi:MAG: sodium-dependent transporter [Nitrospirota bacterium]|nr:sodium-dependent transporter [Nitrospirota bacterium]MDH5295789.1 sodium-dependent transporter [Nitrospirota bacterium]MDH5575570.1 sodium-dependent transporter [Nitrospirota bacterium]
MNISNRQSVHGQWSSRWTFILAATGAAVGLGNIWKFPYLTGQNGGSAFVLVYVVCVAALGIPLMMAEILLGRRGRSTPIRTMQVLAEETNTTQWWQIIGWSGTLAGMLILSYYSVIGGWTLAYIFKSTAGTFSGASGQFAAETFGHFVGSPTSLFIWHTFFMILTMGVVAGGVQGGLEKAVQFLMPTLFFLLLLMVGYSMTTGFFGKGLEFLFTPDFSKLTGASMLSAMGQAFFSLSLGMGTIMIYGSYVPKDTSIASTSIIIALADTLVALLAGMAIFPIVFANNLEPGSGPGLIFQTLPVAFGNMAGGQAFGSLFFILLLVAAWTSSISLIEPLVTWLIETYGMTRIKSSLYSGIATWLFGLGTVWSFNWWAELTFFGLTFFDLLDFVTSNLMLPLGGILMALFAGWFMKAESTKAELNIHNPTLYLAWQALVRYIAPVAVFIVLLNAIGIL